MRLFSTQNNILKSIPSNDFKLERDIQNLIEKNLEELFNIKFVMTELRIKNFRIDTLGYDVENKSFVVIEYKRDRNFSVIDQGYTYMSLMLNNKSDFILEYNENCDSNLKRDDVDWSQSKVIFISPHFTEYQKHSINFKDVPFELWEITKYDNNLIGLIQHKTTSVESISTTVIGKSNSIVSDVSKQIKVYDEEYHFNKSKNPNQKVIELYKELKEKLLNLGDVAIEYKGTYISFKKTKPFTDIVIYLKGLYIIINMKKGTLNDPENITEDVSETRHWGNGDYSLTIRDDTNLDYLMFLINQSYKNQV